MNATMEQAIAVVRASVMIYDDGTKRWLPAGQSGQNVESKVQLFQHLRASTYRIVARKGPEHEVVLNCPLYAAMKYNRTTATFHQWRTEQRQLYGLNFVSQDDAQTFGQAMCRAIEALSAAAGIQSGQQQMTSQNGTYEHHQHNGLPGVASAPTLIRQQQQQHAGNFQQPQHYMAHAASTGDYGVQQQQQTLYQRGTSQDDAQHQLHQNSLYQQQQQQQASEAYYGVSPALHLQHQRQPSAGSNASSSGSSACTTSQTSNLIYSTVTPTNIMPSPSRPAPPVPPPPPPPPMPASVKGSTGPIGGGVPPAPPPPPPPLPPPSNTAPTVNSTPKQQQMNFAQAISTQKLRKVPSGSTSGRPATDETGMNKDSRSASVGSVDATISAARATNNSGFGGGGGGHSDVISEMAATLARRRLLAESGAAATSSSSINNGAETSTSQSDSVTRTNEKGAQKVWEARNGSRPSLNEAPSSSTDSPRTHRKVPSGSSLSSQEDVGLSLMASGAGGSVAVGPAQRSLSNGPTSAAAPLLITAETLEQWKQDILNEVRREINKAKAEIIDALKSELNRR